MGAKRHQVSSGRKFEVRHTCGGVWGEDAGASTASLGGAEKGAQTVAGCTSQVMFCERIVWPNTGLGSASGPRLPSTTRFVLTRPWEAKASLESRSFCSECHKLWK